MIVTRRPGALAVLDLGLLGLGVAAAAAGTKIGGPQHLFVVSYALLAVMLVLIQRPAPGSTGALLRDPVGWIPGRLAVSALVSLLVAQVCGVSVPVPVALYLWLGSLLALATGRGGLSLIARLGSSRSGAPTLIVGAGVVGTRVAQRLLARPEIGLRPVGFLDGDPVPGAAELAPQVPVLGSPGQLAEAVMRTGARHVVLAFSQDRDAELVGVVRRCHELGLHVSVVPRLYESVNRRMALAHVGGLPLLQLSPAPLRGCQFAFKHAVDRVLALLALVALTPLLVAIVLAVRCSSAGPVIFRQRRIGRDGQPFDLFKFRTMRLDDGPARFTPVAGSAPGGVEGVDRRTRIGRWLRQTSLDELPQLVNVLRGEMSLVGPRPERPEFVERFATEIDGYRDRHRVKVGITGWAQVNGLRGQTSIADRVEWDNHYIENWSLGLELKTLLRTVSEVVRFREDRTNRLAAAGAGAPAPEPALVAGSNLMPESPVLRVDSRLTVESLSAPAATLLGIEAEEAVGRPLPQLLVAADSELHDAGAVVAALRRAGNSQSAPERLVLRPPDTFGVRFEAAISACAPGAFEIALAPQLAPAAGRPEAVAARRRRAVALA
jgi:exopolysaccharide biosynthesis polyprenyl glycosylphosphotransferase